jgi:hypothetical protein
MTIECVHCKELVVIPEDVIQSSKKTFTCHLCHTKQQIKTVKTMKENMKAGNLYVYYDEKLVGKYDIFEGKYIVGRTSQDKKSDIQISGDDYLGRQHFILEVSDTKNGFMCSICDNRSKNGTKIIQKRKELKLYQSDNKIFVSNHDKIIAGKTTFEIELFEMPQKNGHTVVLKK